MKRRINEENYNEIIKLGVCNDKQQVTEIIGKLKEEGVDAYNEGSNIYITVERDNNNPHYIDDVKDFAMNIFNDVCGNMTKMKLACSKKKNRNLTENKLRKIIKEAVLKEYFALNNSKQITTELTNLIYKWWSDNATSSNRLPREEIMNFAQKMVILAIE